VKLSRTVLRSVVVCHFSRVRARMSLNGALDSIELPLILKSPQKSRRNHERQARMFELADCNPLSLIRSHLSDRFGYSLHVQSLAYRHTGTLVPSNELSNSAIDTSTAAMKPK
jgi:hypothetical protein